MKQFITILCSLFLLSGCEDLTPPINPLEEEPIITVTTGEASDILKNSASVKINVSPIASIKKVGVVWGTDNTLKTNTEDISTTDITSQEVSLTLLNLTDNTDYYYRAYATDFSNKNTYGEVKSFKTGSHQFTVSTTNIEAGYSADDYSFTIHSDITWAITSDQSWCKVQPASGSGNAEIKIQLEENLLENERTAILTISPNENIASQTITIKQATKGSATFSDETIAASTFERGSGTEDDPFLIVNASQLKKLVDDVSHGEGYFNKHFKLKTDIHVTISEWTPIGFLIRGEKYISFFPFKGTFDGNEHTISGNLISSKYSTLAFFGCIEGAIIRNLNISAEIRNEDNNNSVLYTSAIVACISPFNSALIDNCTASGSISSIGGESINTNYLGGIVGSTDDLAIIKNCNVSGSVRGGAAYSTSVTGGIIGTIGVSTIENCIVTGDVIGGEATCYVQSENSALVGTYSTGGIAGWGRGTISDCIVSASIIGGAAPGGGNTGGIYGDAGNGIIKNCIVTSDAIITSGKGTILKYSQCNTGGISGKNHGTIDNCTNNATVNNGDTSARTTGGIVGQNYGKIHRSLNTGSITSLNSYYIGGLVGSNVDNDLYTGCVYSCCRNTGRVNGQVASDDNRIGNQSQSGIATCPDNHTKR
ncbi:hypothetical protein M2480_000963 [Parabacteroides sp. PFB2-12]|uniref:BACON domain-containing protein n=1 Tax=unclassified Parabacteroides TaxID=2649774 RepID=UPI0024763803|nr:MULTISPECIES: BACON domain-containing protein [unclassified Parabacteroides]MDH6341580.1 hypothetical protein [Parabacteroides sp. PM6-13]MDH6389997.1 hypothetical protein [Parabacteroides sp. PFB2-12]